MPHKFFMQMDIVFMSMYWIFVFPKQLIGKAEFTDELRVLVSVTHLNALVKKP